MSRRYRRLGSILLTIICLAIVAVGVLIALIYSNGVRYIKNSDGEKFFGFIDKNNIISEGKIWRSDGTVINISKEKFTSVLYRPDVSDENGSYTNLLIGEDFDGGGLDEINEKLNTAQKAGNALGEIALNGNVEEYCLLRETVIEFLTEEQRKENYVSEGFFTTDDGVEWILTSPNGKATGYSDFTVAKKDDESVVYKGGLASFLKKESIKNGCIILRDASQLVLFQRLGAHRMIFNMPDDVEEIYIGQISAEFKPDGKGLCYFAGGEIYYGEFIKGEREGNCKIKTAEGDLYRGGIAGNKKSGQGVYIWSDGTYYEGGFADNKKNGYGKYVYANGESYEGDYLNDLKHGKGVYTWANGDVYTGDFVDDARTGTGIYIWAESGERYEGEFKNNELDGTGTYYWPSTRTYTGPFSKGKMVTLDEAENGGDEVSTPQD